MPIPGNFPLVNYASLAKKAGLPTLTFPTLPDFTTLPPKGLIAATPQLPAITLNPSAVVDHAADQAASGFASAMDAADRAALAAVSAVNPITGSA